MRFLLLLLLCQSLFSCREDAKAPVANVDKSSQFDLTKAENKSQWLQRLSFKLWDGHELTSEQEEKWSAYTPATLVDLVMSERYYDFALTKFFLFYLGVDEDGIRFPKEFKHFSDESSGTEILDFSSVVTAVREATKVNGDIWKIVELHNQVFLAPLKNEMTRDSDGNIVSQTEVRNKVIKTLTNYATFIQGDAGLNWTNFCGFTLTIANEFFNSGVDVRLRVFFDSMFKLECFVGAPPPTDIPEDELKTMRAAIPNIQKVIDLILYLGIDYNPTTFGDLKDISLDVPIGDAVANSWYWIALQNSSTNFNRRRAAYVFNRFLCDDLTPLPIDLPENHGEGRHASDPGCFACHYKLDPMAGFFKNRGGFGENQAAAEFIKFSDGAKIPRLDYHKNWQDEAGKYNVGFIRSVIDPTKNVRPKNPETADLQELSAMLRELPEAKQCLVRRAFEFLVGSNVALDPAMLETWTKEFELQSKKKSSSYALRRLMKTIVLSNSFIVDSPETGKCYDRVDEGESQLPCEIGHLLRKNCIGCHGESTATHLNLAKAGVGTPFSHLDQSGKPLPYGKSLELIKLRLESNDPKTQMPPGFIIPSERHAIHQWIISELQGGAVQ